MIFKENAQMSYDYAYVINPKLKIVMDLVDAYSMLISGKPIVVTSLIRPPRPGHPSYHPVGRAFDMRTKITDKDGKITYVYTDEQFKLIQKFAAGLRSYDDNIQLVTHPELLGTNNHHYHFEIDGKSEGVKPE